MPRSQAPRRTLPSNDPELPTDWYEDPDGSGGERWWDGECWTKHLRFTANATTEASDHPAMTHKRALIIMLVIAAASISVLVGYFVWSAFQPSDYERIYLDVVKSDHKPDWVAWPSDKVLLEQGHQIWAELRRGVNVFEVAGVLMTDAERRGADMGVDRAFAQMGAATALCGDQSGNFHERGAPWKRS